MLEDLIKDALDLTEKELSVDDETATLSPESTAVSRACAALPSECTEVLNKMNFGGCSAQRVLIVEAVFNCSLVINMHREWAQTIGGQLHCNKKFALVITCNYM